MALAIFFLALGIVLVLLEVFIPSGGILGALATAAIVVAVVLGFKEGTNIGLAFLVVVAVVVPVATIMGLKIFPHTPLGRRVILNPAVETPDQRGAAGVADEDYSQLVGQLGKTVTPLRPSGIVEIENQRFSAVTEGEMLEANIDIVVNKIEGNSIVVDERPA